MKRLLALLLIIPSFCFASQFTTNYRLEIPASGQRDWLPIISNDIISIDSILKIISSNPASVTSVTEGVASPLVINPTSGAVVISMLSADETQAGYIDSTQYKKVNILSSDVNNLIVKTNILSNDAILQDNKLTILSNDVNNHWGILTNDAVIQNTKLQILSNDALIQDVKLNILSTDVNKNWSILTSDAVIQDNKLQILSNDAILQDNKIQILSNDALIQDVKLSILSSDVNKHWNILTADAIVQDTKLQILSNDALVQNNRLDILSNDAVVQDNKLTILSNDAVIQDNKLTIISNDVGSLKTLTNIISAEVGTISREVGVISKETGIISSDVNLLQTKTTIISTDIGLLTTKVGIISSEVGVISKEIGIISRDSLVQDTKLQILTNDIAVITPKVNNLSSDVGLLKAPTYIVQTASDVLTNEQALSSLATGIMQVTNGTGVIASLGNILPVANGGTASAVGYTVVSNDISDLKNKTTIISTDVNALEDRVEVISGEVGTISRDVNALSSDAAWSKSGTNVFLITSTNSVGIGTSTPNSKLKITPTVGNTSALSIDSSIAGMTNVLTVKDTLATGGNLLELIGDSNKDNGGEFPVVVSKVGKVGILSKDPAYPLTISSDSSGNMIQLCRGGGTAWTTSYASDSDMGSSPMLKITNNVDAGLSLYLDAVSGGQRLYIWDATKTLPNIPHTGIKPTLAVYGDILVGDIVALERNPMTYFIRPELNLPVTSVTSFFSARNSNADTDGGSTLTLAPLSTDGGAVNDGYINVAAYGKGTGTLANSIRFMNRSGVNTLADRAIINTDGYLGIGTTTPGSSLSIVGSITEDVAVGKDALKVVSSDATTTVFMIDKNNNVGVGTSTMTSKLTVQQDAANYGLLLDQNANNTALYIDTEATTTNTILVKDPTNTTASIFVINTADALTTGGLMALLSNSADTSSRNLATIANNNASASGATCLKITQKGSGSQIIGEGNENLSNAGVWTDRTSTYADKTEIAPLITKGFLDKIKKLNLYSYKKKCEVYGNKENIYSSTEFDEYGKPKLIGNKYPNKIKFPNARTYEGFILDDPSTPEELISRNVNGDIDGISPAMGVNFLLAVNKELVEKVEQLENRINILEERVKKLEN